MLNSSKKPEALGKESTTNYLKGHQRGKRGQKGQTPTGLRNMPIGPDMGQWGHKKGKRVYTNCTYPDRSLLFSFFERSLSGLSGDNTE